jgi:hypothetical protein
VAHDRTGELIDPDAHPPNCSGWEDPDADVMRPCLICKPHLAKARLEAKLHGPYAEPQPRRDTP